MPGAAEELRLEAGVPGAAEEPQQEAAARAGAAVRRLAAAPDAVLQQAARDVGAVLPPVASVPV